MTTTLLTIDQVADQLHKSRRWLRDWLREHPEDAPGRTLYRLAGRTKLFTEQQLNYIIEALPCPSSSCRRAKAGRRTGRSVAPTSDDTLTEALRLCKRSVANQVRRQWEREIERGEFAVPGEPDFASAAIAYMKAGGERRFLIPLINHFTTTPLRQINQAAVEAAAAVLYPRATPATQNRQLIFRYQRC